MKNFWTEGGFVSKTVKELAQEFGVSKQAINRRLTDEFKNNYVSEVVGNGLRQLEINDEGCRLLKYHYDKVRRNRKKREKNVASNVADNIPNNKEKDEYKKASLIKTLQRQIDDQRAELNTKNEQIKQLHKMLDQAQQLQLLGDKKVQKLESVSLDKMEKKETTQTPVEESNGAAFTKKDERGFWGRVFRR